MIKKFTPEKGVVLTTQEGYYYRLFDFIHPIGGFIAYPLKKLTSTGFVKLEPDFLDRKLIIDYFNAGSVSLPFLDENKVRKVFTPRTSLNENHNSTEDVDQILNVLVNQFQIPLKDIGFDGSNVYGGADKYSDLDLLVFGKENSNLLLNNLDTIAKLANLKRYTSNPERLIARRKRHLGELSKKDIQYEIKKPVFFKGEKHINITPTFNNLDIHSDFRYANWDLLGFISAKVKILNIDHANQVPSLYYVENLDRENPIEAIESNMFYHSIKGKPGDMALVYGPYVASSIKNNNSRRIILSSWADYRKFKFNFLD